MKEKNEKMYFPKVTQDNYFMTQEERDAENLEKIQIIEISKISNFPNHPYQVKDDDEMQDLSDNIKEYGLIFPLLVRPKEDGTYELISGHRRKRACELAGIRQVKAIVREMTDEEATIQMVDSNKQREKVLPSEKAFAYKMRLEAMKRQAGRPKKEDIENSAPVEQNFSNNKTTREMIADEVGESSSNIQRYIRLTELIPDILKLVDEEQMKLRPAVEISYLKKEEQKTIVTQEITKLNKEKNAIMICENLISTKGFENCVIFVNMDSVSVIIQAEELKTDEIAQIQNIISREIGAEVENIHIMTK